MKPFIPEIFLDNTVEVHDNVCIQIIMPKEPSREPSIAWTRNPDLIQKWKNGAHIVTEGDNDEEFY